MATIANLAVSLTANTASFTKSMNKSAGTIASFTSRVQSGFGRLGGVVAGGLAAIGAGMGVKSSVQAFASFETQMAKIATLMTGDGMRWMPTFTTGIKSLSLEFGESTATLSEGLFDLISSGIAPAQAMEVLRASTMAAKGGFTTTGIAANALSTILVAYRMNATEATSVTDKMVAAANAGKLDFEGLASNIGRVAPSAKLAGISMDQLLATFSTISQVASPEETATLLLNMFKAFGKPTVEARKAADGLGIALGSSALQGDNLIKTMEQLKGLDADTLRTVVPDQQAFQAVAALSGNLDFLKGTLKGVADSAGATQAAFNVVAPTAEMAFNRFGQSVEAVKVQLGAALAPAIMSVANSLSGSLPTIQSYIDTFTGGVKWVIEGVQGIGAQLGITSESAKFFFQNLGLHAEVGGLKIAVAISEAVDSIYAGFVNLGSFVGTWAVNLGSIALNTGKNMVQVFGNVFTYFESLASNFFGVYTRVFGNMWRQVQNFTGNFARAFKAAWESVKSGSLEPLQNMTQTSLLEGMVDLTQPLDAMLQDLTRGTVDVTKDIIDPQYVKTQASEATTYLRDMLGHAQAELDANARNAVNVKNQLATPPAATPMLDWLGKTGQGIAGWAGGYLDTLTSAKTAMADMGKGRELGAFEVVGNLLPGGEKNKPIQVEGQKEANGYLKRIAEKVGGPTVAVAA